MDDIALKMVIRAREWKPIWQMYGAGDLSELYHRAMDWCFGRDKAEWDDGFLNWIVREILQIQKKAENRFKWDGVIEEMQPKNIDYDIEEGHMQPSWMCIEFFARRDECLRRINQSLRRIMRNDVGEIWCNVDCVKERGGFDSHGFKLENVRRTGWTRAVPAFRPGGRYENMGETVADHSLKMAVLAAVMDCNDPMHMFEMGLCHDLAEIVVGDLTPEQAPDRETKHRMECEGLTKMLQEMKIPEQVRERIMANFLEYLECKTEASHLVHIADKVDMALQALVYERLFHLELGEFFDSAEDEIMELIELWWWEERKRSK